MKRFFALLLVIVLVISMSACGGIRPDYIDPTASNDPAAGSVPTTPTDPTAASDPTTDNNTFTGTYPATGNNPTTNTNSPTGTLPTTVGDKPFKGKKLQLYGFGGATSYSAFGDEEGAMYKEGNYLWMQRAAIMEWAAINEVTIEFKGSYNQNVLLTAMQSGENPDMFSVMNQFPSVEHYGLTARFTDAEYNELAKHMKHTKWMDMLTYRGSVNGVILPWTASYLFYVNIDLCDRYNVKSPVDYFMEDNWNWDTMKQWFEAVTRDLDGDGDFDSVAACSDMFVLGLIPETTHKESGALTDEIFDKSYAYDFAEFLYNYQYQKGYIISGRQSPAVMAGTPLVASRLTDGEPYNFKHIFTTLSNGDKVVAIPVPAYEGKDTFQFSRVVQAAMYMASSCDEREAVISLMSYILEAGDKYMSMLSGGVIKSAFTGITGECEHSVKWLNQFAKACSVDRAAERKECKHYDAAIMKKVNEYLNDPNTTWSAWGAYQCVDVKEFTRVCTFSDPPATALSAGREAYKTMIEKYNSQNHSWENS